VALTAFSLVGTVEAKTDGAEQGIKRVDQGLQNLQARFNKPLSNNFSRPFQEVATGIVSKLTGAIVAGDMITRLAASFTEAAKAVVEFSGKLEQTKVGFTTLIGSAAEAEQHIQQLRQLAEHSPFGFEDLLVASRRFLAMGTDAKKVIPLLTDVGNAVAAIGGGAEEIDSVTTALSRMAQRGQVSELELLHLSHSGINGIKILSTELGISTAEVRKLTTEGKISADTFITAFQKFSRENFGDAMEKQSHTFLGSLSIIKDALLVTASTAFEPLFKKISEITDRMAQEMIGGKSKVESAFQSLSEGLLELAGNLGKSMGKTMAEGVVSTFKTFTTTDDWKDAEKQIIAFMNGLAPGDFKFDKQGYLNVPETAIPQVPVPDLAPVPLPKDKTSILGLDNTADVAKKTADIFNELIKKVSTFGEASEVAATKEKLLTAGVTDLNTGLAAQAMKFAAAADAAKTAADQQLAEQNRIFDRNQSIAAQMLDSAEKTTEQIAQLGAQFKGGLSEVDKFNLGLAITAAQAGQTADAIQLVRYSLTLLDQAKVNNQFEQHLKELSDRAFELGGKIDGGRTPREELQKWLQDTGLLAKFTTNQLKDLTDEADKIANAKVLNDLNRGVSGLAKEETNKVRSFQRKDDGEVSGLAQSLAAIPELNVEPAIFDKLIAFFKESKAGAVDFAKANDLVDGSLEHLKKIMGDSVFDKFKEEITKIFIDADTVDRLNKIAEATAKYKEELGHLNGIILQDREQTQRQYIEMLLLTDAYRDLTDAQKENLKLRASEADAHLRQVQETERLRHQLKSLASDITNIFDNSIQAAFEGGWKAMFRSIGMGFAQMLEQMANDLLRSNILRLLEKAAGITPAPGSKEEQAQSNSSQNLLGGLVDKLLVKLGLVKPKAAGPGALGKANAGPQADAKANAQTISTATKESAARVTEKLGSVGHDITQQINAAAEHLCQCSQQPEQQSSAQPEQQLSARERFNVLVDGLQSAYEVAKRGVRTTRSSVTSTVSDPSTGEVLAGGGPGGGTVPQSISQQLSATGDQTQVIQAVNNSSDQIVSAIHEAGHTLAMQGHSDAEYIVNALTPRSEGFLSGLLKAAISGAASGLMGGLTKGGGGGDGGGSVTSTVSDPSTGEILPGGGHAMGGIINGPGSETSDSIMGIDRRGIPTAMVSRGEFVVNAQATRKQRAALELINRTGELPHLGLGGFLKWTSAISHKGFRDVTMPISHEGFRNATMPITNEGFRNATMPMAGYLGGKNSPQMQTTASGSTKQTANGGGGDTHHYHFNLHAHGNDAAMQIKKSSHQIRRQMAENMRSIAA